MLKKDAFPGFLQCYLKFDQGTATLTEMLKEVNNEKYFKEYIGRTNFIEALSNAISGVNAPIFNEIRRFKEMGRGELVMITDNNHYCFDHTVYKFPEVLELFGYGTKENYILSWEEKCLKRDGNLFHRAFSKFGFSANEAVFTDDLQVNIEGAKKAGFDEDACFLYKPYTKRSNIQFSKFLDKHFPAK